MSGGSIVGSAGIMMGSIELILFVFQELEGFVIDLGDSSPEYRI